MTEHERQLRLSWAAGFFDGEGCVSIAKGTDKRGGKNYRRHQLSIIVVQRDRRPLDLFIELFGGGLRKSYRRNYDAVYWEWKLFGKNAIPVLRLLLPYLVVKREAAEVAIEFQDFMNRTEDHSGKRQRTPEQYAVMDMYHAKNAVLNMRASKMDYTVDRTGGELNEKETGRQVN